MAYRKIQVYVIYVGKVYVGNVYVYTSHLGLTRSVAVFLFDFAREIHSS